MAESSSNFDFKKYLLTKSLLLKNRGDLVMVKCECKTDFEVKFWYSKVLPMIKNINDFFEYDINAKNCRIEAEILLIEIRRFRGVYGIVRIVYKIVQQVRDLF